MTTSLATAGEVPGLLSLLAEDVYDFDDCGRKLTDRLTQRVDRISVGCWLTDLSDQKVDQTTGRRQAGRDFDLVQPSNKIGRVSELPDHFFRHSTTPHVARALTRHVTAATSAASRWMQRRPGDRRADVFSQPRHWRSLSARVTEPICDFLGPSPSQAADRTSEGRCARVRWPNHLAATKTDPPANN